MFVFIFMFYPDGKFLQAIYYPVNAAIVLNAQNGEIIYSYNADQKTQPASLAKMMTLLLTFKALQRKKVTLTTMIRISPNAASQKPSILGLKSGEYISVQNAILALIVKSANDIAVALAEYIGGTEKQFVSLMNKEAKRLGMSSTIFFNPSGWKNPRQLTTARDMAKLARALLLEYPGYYHLFSNKQFYIHNKCIKGHYRLLGKRGNILVDGIKTGFVNASGYNLAASGTNGNNRLIAVVLGSRTSKQRDALVDLLLKKGFFRLSNKKMIKNNIKHKTTDQETTLAKSAYSIHMVAGIYNKINALNAVPKNNGGN
ncbi:MAG: D-alanyl-D-alanine carboxypeptidase [Holosporaceae bacterium]|jgi:D-alanyl-D-alanine carboxypeptidase|nr:D-alanyl-D-alanine carboxypeptidase [Holosporaceae bacterium]